VREGTVTADSNWKGECCYEQLLPVAYLTYALDLLVFCAAENAFACGERRTVAVCVRLCAYVHAYFCYLLDASFVH